MCDASSQQKSAAGTLNTLTKNIMGQVSQVFGNDQTVFANLMNANQSIVAGGPGQQGFSQAELNSMTSQAITNNANQYRNVAGAAKAGQAAFGGGNTALESGATTAANLGIAEAAAANTSNQLAGITQADYAQGNQNFWRAQQGEQGAAGTFNNMANLNQSATNAANSNLNAQTQIGNASNWWQKPVMGLATALPGMISAGMGNLDTTGGSSGGEQAGNFLSGALGA
jgi:hypothetical protein